MKTGRGCGRRIGRGQHCGRTSPCHPRAAAGPHTALPLIAKSIRSCLALSKPSFLLRGTVIAHYRYTTREGQFYCQNGRRNSIQKSTSSSWVAWKFLRTMHTGSPRSRNEGTWTVTTRATTWPRYHHKTRDFFSNLTEFLRTFYRTFMTSFLIPVILSRKVSLGLYDQG